MSRSKRSSVAAETVEICKLGHYQSSNGQVVNLSGQIAEAVAETTLYSPNRVPVRSANRAVGKTRLAVTEETTLSAVIRLSREEGGHLACLNFASAKNPGGGFLNGAEAQEESLARASALYPCLLAARDYYEQNRFCSTSLYLDLVIWSPQVPHFRDDSGALLAEPVLASVITAPAPNAGAIARNEPAKSVEVEPTLRKRAALVLAVAAERNVRRLVLGAWGCGVFRNDPSMVASAFRDLISGDFADVFDQVVYAIYDRTPDKQVTQAFQKIAL